jgi:hypothetical protein
MGGGPAFPLRFRSEDNKRKVWQESEGFNHPAPKAEPKAFQNDTDQDDETSLKPQAGHHAMPKAPQPRTRSWNRQEIAEIRRRNIRGHIFAKMVDRYLAGEEIADILISIPEQPLLVLTYEDQERMHQEELRACLKLPLPGEDDGDL